MPITASTIAVSIPANTWGIMLLTSKWVKVCQRLALMDCMTSRWPRSTERTPSRTLSITGKKASSAAMMTLVVMPKPNQMTKRGISATLGMTSRAMISGRTLASSSGSLPSRTPTTTPAATPTEKPIAISMTVT